MKYGEGVPKIQLSAWPPLLTGAHLPCPHPAVCHVLQEGLETCSSPAVGTGSHEAEARTYPNPTLQKSPLGGFRKSAQAQGIADKASLPPHSTLPETKISNNECRQAKGRGGTLPESPGEFPEGACTLEEVLCRGKAGPRSRVGLENTECQETPMARQSKAGHASQTWGYQWCQHPSSAPPACSRRWLREDWCLLDHGDTWVCK